MGPPCGRDNEGRRFFTWSWRIKTGVAGSGKAKRQQSIQNIKYEHHYHSSHHPPEARPQRDPPAPCAPGLREEAALRGACDGDCRGGSFAPRPRRSQRHREQVGAGFHGINSICLITPPIHARFPRTRIVRARNPRSVRRKPPPLRSRCLREGTR